MEARLDQATKVLDEVLPKQIPKKVIKDCKGIALVNAQEYSVVLTGGAGGGVLLKNNGGSWGPPIAITTKFFGVGANFGFANKFMVIVAMSDNALKKLTQDRNVDLGGDLGAAFGPGTESEIGVADGIAPVYTYTYERGVLSKAGLNGTVISHEKESNEKFYGADKSPSEIVMEAGAVSIPEGNRYLDEFYKKLDSLAAE